MCCNRVATCMQHPLTCPPRTPTRAVETVEQATELRKGVKLRPLQGKVLHAMLDDTLTPEHAKTAAAVAAQNAPLAMVLNIESQARGMRRLNRGPR